MLEDARIQEARSNMRSYEAEGLVRTDDPDARRFVPFYLSNAVGTLQSAALLQRLSVDVEAKRAVAAAADFESFLWVIVQSYYSMYYAASALLASQGVRVGHVLVHKVTADALIARFIANKELARLIAEYDDSRQDALDIMGYDERARQLAAEYEQERRKRSRFQYEMGARAKRAYAETSLERAKRFVHEVRKVLEG